MLYALDPDETRPPPAYAVPWRVDRIYGSHPLVTNVSDEPLDFVRVFVRAGNDAVTSHWGQLVPGETAELCLCDVDTDDTIVTLAWFRPATGVEYVWRFVV